LSVINISFNISLFLKKRKHQLCLVVSSVLFVVERKMRKMTQEGDRGRKKSVLAGEKKKPLSFLSAL
jgi:hypothetical protein